MIHAFPPAFFKNILCFFILFSSLTAYTQEKDSLQQYSYEELDSLYFKNLQQNLTKAKQYAQLLFRKAIEKKNYPRVVKGLMRISIIEGELRNFDSAHLHIDQAISIIDEELKDTSLKNEHLVYKGNLYFRASDYNKALEYYTKSYEYEKKANNLGNSFNIAHNIAMINSIIGNYDEALSIFKKNYIFFSEKEGKEDFSSAKMLTSLIGLTDTYLRATVDQKNSTIKSKLLDSTAYYNKIGLEKSVQYKDQYRHIYFLIRNGKIAYEKQRYQEAIQHLNLAYTKAKEIGQKGSFSAISFQLGKNYKELAQPDNAILFLKKVDSIAATDAKQTSNLAETYLILTDLYIKKQDVENALKYQKAFVEIDEISDKQNIEIQKKIYEKYNIPLLNDEIKKLTDTTKKQESKYTTAISALAIVTIAFLTFFVYNRNKQKKNRLAFDKLIKELETKKKETSGGKIEIITSDYKSNSSPKASLTIDEEKVQKILTELNKFEQKKQFLDINCNLSFVAKKVKTNKAYLSKVIHTEKQQKFIQYITNLRIDYALEKLKEDKLFRSYDIKSIATELGFKSPDSFSRAFKNKTGIYPSYYIKNINKINNSQD